MSDAPAIAVRDLSKTYRDGWLFAKRFPALRGVSLEVAPGQIFGLLGPNGAGKTTFLKILLGIIRKSGGEARMMGLPAGSRAVRRLVGYLPEQLRIPSHMTGYTALECYGNLSNVPAAEIRRKRGPLLEMVGLGERGADPVKKYSKGMRQRLGLAQALLHEPRMLVLDEPTDGLDPGARAEMREVIRQLQGQGVTIFLNSHILQEVEMICDTVAVLDRGQLRYSGPVSEIGNFVAEAGAGKRVLMRLGGEASAIAAFVAEQGGEAAPGGEVNYFRFPIDDQAAQDRLVDTARDRQLSLLELRLERISLEQAFLTLVEDGAENANHGVSTKGSA